MQLDRQAERLGRVEDARRSARARRRCPRRSRRPHRPGLRRRSPAASRRQTMVDIGVLVAVRLRRQRMRAEEGGAHRHRPLVAEPARGAQRLRLVVEVEAVAGLDLDRGDAFGDQRVEARQRLRDELVLARRARRLDRGDDAAAGPRDLLIGRAGEPHLELVGAVAGIDEMGVAVDQAGRDPAAVAVDASRRRVAQRAGRSRFRPGKDDPAVAGGDGAARRCRGRRSARQGRQAGIAPDAPVEARRLLAAAIDLFPLASCDDRLCIYILNGAAASAVSTSSRRSADDGDGDLLLDQALLADGWRANVRLDVEDGIIAAVEPGRRGRGRRRAPCDRACPACPTCTATPSSAAWPGSPRSRGPAADSFWSWREVMYRFALAHDAGRCRGGRRPALCRDAGGRLHRASASSTTCTTTATARPMPTSPRWPSASPRRRATTGIGLTLLPVFYAHGGFGGARADRRAAALHQRSRPLRPPAREARASAVARLARRRRRRRAAQPARGDARRACGGRAAGAATGPIHIHVAEQVKEVEDCLAWSGARPVEWLLGQCAGRSRAGA